MKYLLFVIALIIMCLCISCEAGQVNFLDLQQARYKPDTAYFQAILDPDNGVDARRLEFNLPFETGAIQGIEGGFPREYRIVRIDCDAAHAEAAGQFYLRPTGRVTLDCKHSVPPGLYTFSIEVSNENGRNSGIIDKAVTIVVK